MTRDARASNATEPREPHGTHAPGLSAPKKSCTVFHFVRMILERWIRIKTVYRTVLQGTHGLARQMRAVAHVQFRVFTRGRQDGSLSGICRMRSVICVRAIAAARGCAIDASASRGLVGPILLNLTNRRTRLIFPCAARAMREYDLIGEDSRRKGARDNENN